MDASNLPKGKADEVYGDGRKRNPIGMYFHPTAKVAVTATSVPQADAFVRLGYVFANAEQKKFIAEQKAKLTEKKEEK